ncbi:DUF3231 family protein [Piscibacillus salipiscarius]|uniref:DUF3231 family protein n=1 Tax=Piscibacillus salipiscarius TaxID=299480 RepID=A0ABW5Q8U7_9BACI
MSDNKQIRLTSSEISQLWTQYMNDTASVCMLTYFLNKAEDQEIKTVIESALNISLTHIDVIKSIFKEEKFKVPHGFTVEEDVDLEAPRLYADSYVLHYIHQMAKIGLTSYAVSLSYSVRSDITEFYQQCLDESQNLYEQSKDLLLNKGIFIRSPYIDDMESIEYVQKQGFLWDVFGEKRSLTALEITNLYANIQRNALGTATLIGFSQVAQTKEVTDYFVRGLEIAKKHIKLFSEKLKDDDLPTPMSWDSEVTHSTTYTFSERLMMFYTTALISLSVGYYGMSVSTSPRVDIGIMYNRLAVEIQLYSEDGANIMIKNGWLEQPPMASNRKNLADKNKEK